MALSLLIVIAQAIVEVVGNDKTPAKLTSAASKYLQRQGALLTL